MNYPDETKKKFRNCIKIQFAINKMENSFDSSTCLPRQKFTTGFQNTKAKVSGISMNETHTGIISSVATTTTNIPKLSPSIITKTKNPCHYFSKIPTKSVDKRLHFLMMTTPVILVVYHTSFHNTENHHQREKSKFFLWNVSAT